MALNLLVLAVIFASIAMVSQTPPRAPKDTPAIRQWRAQAAAIQRALDKTGAKCPRPLYPVQILDAFGSTGDDLSVALVDFCPGGAYTDEIVAMRMERGEPVLATLRDAQRKIIANDFLQGASVMHMRDVKLVPKQRAIYDLFSNNNSEGKLSDCGVKAYVWNAKTYTFDRDVHLSKKASREFCRSLRDRQ